MSGEEQQKKIGGEYGKIRAIIDVAKLNSFLSENVKAIQTPVDVKQFKVSYTHSNTSKRQFMDN
jgi:hypothetical protein